MTDVIIEASGRAGSAEARLSFLGARHPTANERAVMTSAVAVSVTLHDGRVIKFEMNDAAQDGTSYSVDSAGVLTIESRRIKTAGELVVRHQRFSPAAWHCVEEADVDLPCAVPPWVSGVVGSSVLSGQR